jgi:hypothetical protein
MEQEDINGHKNQQFIVFKMCKIKELPEYLIALIGKYHQHGIITRYIGFQYKIGDFNLDFFRNL